MEDRQFDNLARAFAAGHSRRSVLRGALAGAGALALLGPRGGSAKNNKVQICHRKGNGSWNLIEVSENAVDAHLGHGDGLLGSQDHCGSCGDACADYDTCGGGEAEGQCGCTPTFTEDSCDGVTCGENPDGCGGTVTCGCTDPEICGGGGIEGQCGCSPTFTDADCDGDICGEISDGCNGTVTCGCSDYDTCGGGGTDGQCGCTPTFTENDCDGVSCGEFPDGCGGTVTCGCSGFDTCGGGETDGQCGCTPTFTVADCDGVTCGENPDGCGGTVTCGCGNGQVCGAEASCVTPDIQAVQTSDCRAQAVLTNFPPNTVINELLISGRWANGTTVVNLAGYYNILSTDAFGSLTQTSDTNHIDGAMVEIGASATIGGTTYASSWIPVTCSRP